LPELPEVEYVRRLLKPAMQGARIERAVLRRADLRYPFGDDFVTRLEGQRVIALTRRAKYLVAQLESGDSLVMHLGMSGWFRVVRNSRAGRGPQNGPGVEPSPVRFYYERGRLDAHDHVVFEMSSGTAVIFNDPRRFGFMKVMDRVAVAADPALGALGPEPLDRSFTAERLAAALSRTSKVSLKAALLDQRVVAGLGNIYVCEALHRARLSPKRRAATIVSRSGAATPKADALVDAIKTTLRAAIARGHRADAADRFLVYDREGRRCPRRGCGGTIARIVQSGRSTFYCPVCQK
jgi:formamidopyrimidine-DNA glycosylase